MDLAKFLALLEDSALYFPSLPELSAADPLEGYVSNASLAEFAVVPDRAVAAHNLTVIRLSRELLYVNSWHLADGESAAMWRLYTLSNQGLAIRSSIGSLKKAFANAPQEVLLGTVSYVDYDSAMIDWRNVINLALHKRRSFAHEAELRALVLESSTSAGIQVQVDLKCLIDEVFLAPAAPAWQAQLVRQIVRRYDVSVEVKHSRLDDPPPY